MTDKSPSSSPFSSPTLAPLYELDGGQWYFREVPDGPCRWGPFPSEKIAAAARADHMRAVAGTVTPPVAPQYPAAQGLAHVRTFGPRQKE